MMRVEAEAHGEAEPSQGLDSSRRHAPHWEGSRSSSLYTYPAGGSTDTSSAGSRRLPLGHPRRLGKSRRLPNGDGTLTTHPLSLITRAERSEGQAWERPEWTASPARYPLPLASIILAPDAKGTTSSVRRTHTGGRKQLHYSRQGSLMTQDEFKMRC
jgi:hypothetical protein